jgi:hypothetical protein
MSKSASNNLLMGLEMSKPIRYEDRYCLFLDILGFKEVVEQSALPGPTRLERDIPSVVAV